MADNKANNKSDYTKNFMDLVDLIPEPLQSDANISIFNNIFNRYLTKTETEKVAGYIGLGNPNAIVSRQIQEATVHRQGYQLQPIPYAKIGSVEHMASWKDIQNELERLGVDMDDFSDWGATKKFNWVPPIDINKIINYRDYYWVGDTNDLPQYITIRSRCATAISRLSFWEGLISQYGSTFVVDELLEIDDPAALNSYQITDITTSPNVISISGDATTDIALTNFINVIGTASNNGVHKITATPIYDGVTNTTTLVSDTALVTETPTTLSFVTLRRYDKIVILPNAEVPTGDYTDLFEENFVFFYRNSTNLELNNSFLKTVSSSYDTDELKTTITITSAVTDDTADGEISLQEELSIFEANKACACDEIGGWDTGLWDDNPAEPLWGDDEDAAGNPPGDGISDFTNLIDRISNPGPPTSGVGTQGELWYDTVANILYQFDTTLDWVIIFNNFSLILDEVSGLNLWDLSASCSDDSRIAATDQWINENKWLHKNEITNFASVRRANQPIIEYDWDLELNEWTTTNYRWSYRNEVEASFAETQDKPPIIELEELIWWEHESTTGTTIILDDRYGDLTDYFTDSRQVFAVAGITKQLLFVDYSEYKASPTSFPYRTFVTFTTRAPDLGSPSVSGDLTLNIPNSFSLIPFETLQGDSWADYGIHWLFLGADDSLPIFHQPPNPFIPIDDTQIAMVEGSPAEYRYTTSLYAENYLTATATQTEFYLENTIPATTTRPLSRKALFGHDDIRVYSADAELGDPIREFGTYDEIGEAVFTIVGIDFLQNEFVLGGGDQTLIGVDFSTYFAPGATIRLTDNDEIAPQEFTVVSVNSLNKIQVTETIPATTSVTGTISNITTPITDLVYPNDFIFSNSRNVTVYAIGIKFFAARLFNINVRIIVGPAAINDIGTGVVKVRTLEDEEQYNITGDIAVTTIPNRVVEQIKTVSNQYPLFDIFNVEGESAQRANQIFGYKTASDQVINTSTGFRIVYDAAHDIYEFDQFLLDEDDGELFAYRDYANRQFDIWYNEETREVKFWDEVTWSDKTDMSDHYRGAVVSDIEPDARLQAIDGLYWYDTSKDKMFIRNVSLGTWIETTDIDRTFTDINLQTIWKAGINEDLYIPDEVDWRRRSLLEYTDERDIFVEARVEELLIADPSLSNAAATILANVEWFASQSNPLSVSGAWVGDWEIPDPLYFNNQHENRKCITSRELLTHFTTIIEEQDDIPGFSGSKDGLFNILHLNDVNYAAGGTIKEFNNGFDTLISSILVNNVTPLSLIEFAHDQYESLLNTIKEIYRKNAVELLSDTNPINIIIPSAFSATDVIDRYELNDLSEFAYSDSTTFTDVDGAADLGVKNWIATLPYLRLLRRFVPERIVDTALGLNEIVHHDSHRNSYELSAASTDIISKILVSQDDPRNPGNPFGEQSTDQPVNFISDFDTVFGSTNNRQGVYWYQLATPSILYRYTVVSAGTSEPSSIYADGTLWMDLTTGDEVLREKNTDLEGLVTWDVVDGLVVGDGRLHNGSDPNDLTTATVSAWQIVDMDIILGDIIFELENRLYENAPTPFLLNYDFDATAQMYPTNYEQYLEEAFLDYASQRELVDPFKNSDFDITDAFTWNYKRSISGGSVTIVAATGLTNSFIVFGDATGFFSAAPTFFVKNSNSNDGTWVPISSTYNVSNNLTTVFVEGDVVDDSRGVAYSGILPSVKTNLQPNNLNDGSESGGDWRDLYEKIYGTPYPHQEPWVLQGYTSTPDWWAEEYLNDNTERWGDRRWKYKHGFAITAVSTADDSFGVTGEFINALISESTFDIDNSAIHQGTYTIKKLDTVTTVNTGIAGTASIVVDDTSGFASSTYTIGMNIGVAVNVNPIPPETSEIKKIYTIQNLNLVGTDLTIVVEEEILAGDIVTGTDYINGSLFTPITNTTTIYVDSFSITDSTVEGRIAKRYGMWESIRTGIIPAGRPYPNGVVSVTGNPFLDGLLPTEVLPTFNYFSVNIDNVSVTADGGATTYAPDDVFPPFWNHTEVYGQIPSVLTDITVRSLYFNFATEIIAPNANYIFGDAGTNEWEWRSSSQYLYDQLTVSYRLDPANFLYSTFGFNFTTIGGLLIDRDVRNTASHTRTNFHGDVVDSSQFISNGLNQWYVNFNRYEGYDANFSDFQSLWTLWTAPMTYQFASFVDTPSLNVAHRFIDLVNFDYAVTSKRSPGVEDFWLDALKIQILDIAFDLAQYNNQIDWRMEVTTNISRSRKIEYYDIHNYQFYADPATDVCTLYTWQISAIDTFDSTFILKGNQEDLFVSGSQFTITGSTGNDGQYDVFSSSYDTVTKLTTVEVTNIITSNVTDGVLTLNYRTLPWETGAGVWLSTTQLLPQPLLGDTVIGTTKYFLIKLSDTTFKLADTLELANAGSGFDITSIGAGDQFVGELDSTFTVASSKNVNWRQYAIDKTNLLSFSTPSQIQGMQPFVDMVRGFEQKEVDDGWVFNEDRTLRDPDTNKIVSWQVEIERFIDYAYTIRNRKSSIGERYPVTADIGTSIWEFEDTNEIFITGNTVTFLSSNTILPEPLSQGITYFMIRDTLETFRLASSRLDAEAGISITLTPTINVGDLVLTTPVFGKNLILPFELNAFKNAAWFQPPSGIISNVITGPVEDIRTSQLIFDQNGERINEDKLRVYRQDKETKFVVQDDAPDTALVSFISPQYNLIRLGGMHIFTDAYEHVLMFNNYTTADNLLYDPFIGLNVSKYEMLFNRNPEFTQRPNVGGYYLETFFNQGANIKENFEAGVESIRFAYDTYDALESNTLTRHSRDALGYDGETEYLSNLNLTRKSQFIFWRGQIQSKGSINAVKAYINSRRFIDAKIDEFWAIKVAEFGSVDEKEYPEMFVTTVDARSNEFKAEFIASEDDGSTVDTDFVPIRISDTTRWYNQPDQLEVLRNNNKIMYFDMKPVDAKTGTDFGLPILNNTNTYIVHGMDVDLVELTYKEADGSTTVLVDQVDFRYINPYVVEILQTGSPIFPVISDLTIWGFVTNYDAQNPARIIDRQAETQLSAVEFWDPARGNHYSNAIHNVDLENYNDPAVYSNTSRTITGVAGVADSRLWGVEEIASSWMDTSTMNYTPYSSDSVISDNVVRFREWGQLHDFGSINIYEWVESDVPPEEWDAIAETEAGDNTIPEDERKSGVAKFTLFEKPAADWIVLKDKVDTQYAATDGVGTGATRTFTIDTSVIDTTRAVDVYINEVKQTAQFGFGSPVVNTIVLTVSEPDVVKFVQPIPTDADVIAAGVTAGTWLQEYEYSTIVSYNAFNEPFNMYYFWVGDKSTKPLDKNRSMSLLEAQQQLVTIPTTHMFFQKPLRAALAPVSSPPEDVLDFPNRFSQVIVRGLQGIIFDDSRYTIRFTRDFTLRDNLEVENVTRENLELKNLHEEWKIFRQEQTSNIDRFQWDKITESIVGFLLTDPLVKIPSFERSLYDDKNGTDTQYGLGNGQVFANGTLALSSILAYLTDPDIDFSPININSFFDEHSFDTSDNIIAAMDTIYSTFKFADVNRMYFSVLHDAFTTKTKYPGLFKTSMVSLHGIKPFQSGGVFDD